MVLNYISLYMNFSLPASIAAPRALDFSTQQVALPRNRFPALHVRLVFVEVFHFNRDFVRAWLFVFDYSQPDDGPSVERTHSRGLDHPQYAFSSAESKGTFLLPFQHWLYDGMRKIPNPSLSRSLDCRQSCFTIPWLSFLFALYVYILRLGHRRHYWLHFSFPASPATISKQTRAGLT
jgi:hypothetical protein